VKALAVVPGEAGSACVVERDAPAGEGAVLVEGLAVGVCGTDVEIASGAYGTAPAGRQHLIVGHESLGRVLDAPASAPFAPGDLVAGIVRRPDPIPCEACAVGMWDMCRNGRYTERGIKELDGYGAERWRVEPEFLVPVAAELGELGVLVEPASVVAKAWAQIDLISTRVPVAAKRVLVTGAGPIGLLAALLGAQRGLEVHVLDLAVDGPKPDLVADLGATYHHNAVLDVPEPDVVVECTGVASVVLDVIGHSAPLSTVCLTGVSSGGRDLPVDVGALNLGLVLENDLVFGSVNANRAHYEAGAAALAEADHAWLSRLVTRHVPLADWMAALEKTANDVKVVVDLTSEAGADVGTGPSRSA
jgi:threonine dehydrogenase-like Zn-dependent dehydrogenase